MGVCHFFYPFERKPWGGGEERLARGEWVSGEASTHVDFSDSNVHYAAHHNKSIKCVPGVGKVMLEAGGKQKSVFSYLGS